MRFRGFIGLLGAGILLGQTDPLLEWIDRTAQPQLDEREATVGAITDRAGAEQRKAVVRKKLLMTLGGLPRYAGPLRARVTGTIPAAGYAIMPVILESPTAAGQYSGMLIPVGQTHEGKPEAQWLAANLSLQGFVAFAYDPIGQGERDWMPWSLRAAFAAPMTNNLFQAMILSFAQHWDFGDLWRAMRTRRVIGTDPTDWMWRLVEAGPWFRYRVVGEGNEVLVEEFLQ